MTKLRYYYICVLGLLLASCVPTKDLIYLQTASSSDASTVLQPIANKPYRLQVNDIISVVIKASDPKLVEVFKSSEQTAQPNKTEQSLYFDGYTVNEHGAIRMPVLGEVPVLGYTLEEVRLKIENQLLGEYFTKEANVFVSVKLAGLRYTVNGEVVQPGLKVEYKEKLTLLEALASAGDITMTGNRKAVSVLRQMPQGSEMHEIDLTDIKALQSPYFYVQPNDYIYVKPLKQKSWGTGKTGLESLSTVITLLTLITTTFILLK
ncbi:MAG: polysaccharide biosynthesis/export family protein [Flavobacterium sp.]|jgi:polysaccharide export outer membrane protein